MFFFPSPNFNLPEQTCFVALFFFLFNFRFVAVDRNFRMVNYFDQPPSQPLPHLAFIMISILFLNTGFFFFLICYCFQRFFLSFFCSFLLHVICILVCIEARGKIQKRFQVSSKLQVKVCYFARYKHFIKVARATLKC